MNNKQVKQMMSDKFMKHNYCGVAWWEPWESRCVFVVDGWNDIEYVVAPYFGYSISIKANEIKK